MSTVPYKPIFARVLIKRDKVAQRKGIILPEEKQLNTGTIVALGEAVDHPDIKVGAKVHWGKNAGANIQPHYLHKDASEEYFICMDEDILGVFIDENEKGEAQ